MKNYNKILKAINRGIKFALDDFEDDELQGQVNSKVKYQGGINEYLDLMNEVVDLGLPSGTLWCKYNLGVDSNQLTELRDWYGDYYAWGELEPNKPVYYVWNNYKFGNADNLIELLPENDVAYQKKKLYNFKFHIPTKEQCDELRNYTNNYWVNNYDPNKTIHNPEDDGGIKNLNGRVFEGKNGNQLFIPAAGFYDDAGYHFGGSYGSLWSRSLDISAPHKAYGLNFGQAKISTSQNDRYYGLVIRPVINL